MLSIVLGVAIVVLLVTFTQKIRSIKKAAKLEQNKLKEHFSKYDGLLSKDEYERQLNLSINSQQNELAQLASEKERLNAQLRSLQAKIRELEEEDYVQSFGFYESKYNFDGSEKYQRQLDNVRGNQKNFIKDNVAAVCKTEWTVEGSKKKGQKMTNDFLKLVLRAFNGECDTAVLKVKYNNINSLEKRIIKTFETLNKLSETTHCEITDGYLKLKLEELYLTHEFQEKKQEELEEQRRIREQMREEERAFREIEKAKEDAEREERRYEEALRKARQDVESAIGKERDKLENRIKQLAQQLEEAHTNKERAVSRAQMTKIGHVYIISNIGSFGDNVYKIGMTRRIEPSERIKELSDASVPFPFDVHAMIFSENAPAMENSLHKYFQNRRLNKINERKEFFKISLDEITLAVERISAELKTVKAEIKFTKVAEAAEYRKTLAMERDLAS